MSKATKRTKNIRQAADAPARKLGPVIAAPWPVQDNGAHLYFEDADVLVFLNHGEIEWNALVKRGGGYVVACSGEPDPAVAMRRAREGKVMLERGVLPDDMRAAVSAPRAPADTQVYTRPASAPVVNDAVCPAGCCDAACHAALCRACCGWCMGPEARASRAEPARRSHFSPQLNEG